MRRFVPNIKNLQSKKVLGYGIIFSYNGLIIYID